MYSVFRGFVLSLVVVGGQKKIKCVLRYVMNKANANANMEIKSLNDEGLMMTIRLKTDLIEERFKEFEPTSQDCFCRPVLSHHRGFWEQLHGKKYAKKII